MRLSILIPVHNEAKSINALLECVTSVPLSNFDVALIVVDDGSRDRSREVVQAFAEAHPEVSLRIIRRETNVGKGTAIRTALAKAESDFCLIQEAGFDPIDYPTVLAPLVSGDADVVIGSRVLNAATRRPLANRAIIQLVKMASRVDISDVETSCKAFRTSLAQTVPLRSERFGLSPEMVIQFAKRHARFAEVPIRYRETTDGEGEQIAAPNLFSAAGSIFRAWLLSAAHTDPAADMLVAMSRASRFNNWMADAIAPWLKGDVIEFGAGIGNLTVLLSSGGNCYTATDTDPEHLAELRSRTANRPNVRIEKCDFCDRNDTARFARSAGTVICLNALEHVADDMGALTNIRCCLRPGGTAVILVPQGPAAFGSMDEVLQHKRRYTREELQHKMSEAGFRVAQITGFNRVTWPGWYLNSRLLRRRTLSHVQLRLFDSLTPVWRRIDDKLPWPPISLIAIGIAD